jgi:hypothetical protein
VPGQRRTLDEYLTDRQRDLESLGGTLRNVTIYDFGPHEATIHAVITFADDTRMFSAFEHIRVIEGRPKPIKYGYRCFHGASFLFGYDYDPVRHREMPYHKHVGGREDRLAADPVTLYDVAEELWSYEVEDIDEQDAEP